VTIPALLLTGGASRRMGTPKALLDVDGQPLAERSARVLTAVCDPVIEVGPGYTDLTCVREEPVGGGPLAALVAGSAAAPAGVPIIVVACDMPHLDPALVRILVEHPGDASIIPEAEGRLQTLCARYGVDARAVAPGLVAAGERSLRSLLAASRHEVLPETQWALAVGSDVFHDLDTPEDLATFRSRRPAADDGVRG
jgi:molybdopterin-guanine dinucleotide biosynthesis protein A